MMLFYFFCLFLAFFYGLRPMQNTLGDDSRMFFGKRIGEMGLAVGAGPGWAGGWGGRI